MQEVDGDLVGECPKGTASVPSIRVDLLERNRVSSSFCCVLFFLSALHGENLYGSSVAANGIPPFVAQQLTSRTANKSRRANLFVSPCVKPLVADQSDRKERSRAPEWRRRATSARLPSAERRHLQTKRQIVRHFSATLSVCQSINRASTVVRRADRGLFHASALRPLAGAADAVISERRRSEASPRAAASQSRRSTEPVSMRATATDC